MSDQQVLIELAQDVGGLKSDVENLAKAQSAQWKKMDEMRTVLERCDRKLDQVVDAHEERLSDVEDGVADYRRKKHLLAGIGIGLGGVSGAVSAFVSKFFNPGGG